MCGAAALVPPIRVDSANRIAALTAPRPRASDAHGAQISGFMRAVGDAAEMRVGPHAEYSATSLLAVL